LTLSPARAWAQVVVTMIAASRIRQAGAYIALSLPVCLASVIWRIVTGVRGAKGRHLDTLAARALMYLPGQPRASPAIDRSNGLHNVLDKARDEYKFVFEHTAGSIAPKACRLRNQR